MAEDGFKVKLHVYDLSQGLARQVSMTLLGKAIEAVWHTGLVVYEKEYYFSGGIQQDPAGKTPYGTPMRVVELGVTHVPKEVFEEYLQEISPRYTAETYSILSHNCNNFSNEVAQFLVGTTIPDYILQLPNEVMNSPMAALLGKMSLLYFFFSRIYIYIIFIRTFSLTVLRFFSIRSPRLLAHLEKAYCIILISKLNQCTLCHGIKYFAL
ncbi:desumoylating isopeptidase 1 [Canna indica]|uniref:Desumoylating isopeptidase 1 n=1 Tax=Canna indica TaxID=4628 RepID=A0AAQ3KF21_9LILI|nr:desumoylating isopeptidase 1 [Canna indica]